MSDFPSNVYACNLLSHRGYPLSTPEPNIELPDSYQREGLKIGDVGVVVPDDGSFDVFFNITLPREHPLHAPDGVPSNFSQVELRREDYRIVPDAECPGRVISSSGVDCTISCMDPFDVNGKARTLTDHHFSFCQNEGAMLILPEGAERHRLAKDLLLLDVIIQNADDWYRFAREQLYRDIRNDALYVVTGFHKACSWSLASFKNTGASSARCKLVQSTKGGPIMTTHSTWETVRPLEWRIGPRHSTGIPNQSVYITGFKIAVKEELLHLKRVTIKVDHSERTLASRFVGFGAGLANFFVGGTSEGTSEVATQHETGNKSTTDHNSPADEHQHVTVERVPQLSWLSHPSDIINRYLLAREPSARIAVTHDSQWITLLEKGILRREDLMQEGHLEEVVSREFHILTRNGAVYLQNIKAEAPSVTNDNDASTPSERYSTQPLLSPAAPNYPLHSSASLTHIRRSFVHDFGDEDMAMLRQLAQIANNPQSHPYRCLWVTDGVVCNLHFQASEFPDHLRTAHGVVGQDETPLMCCWVDCPAAGMKKETLVRHVIERHLELKLICPTCHEQFTRVHTLLNHVSKKHSGN